MQPALYQDVCPPVQGAVTHLAHVTSAVRYETPADCIGAMVTIASLGSDLYIVFGDGGVKVGAAKYAQASGETLGRHWASPALVPAGSSISFPVDSTCTHFSFVSSGTTGSWAMWRSSGSPRSDEALPDDLNRPALWLDVGFYQNLTINSGIAGINGRSFNGGSFTEGTNKPAYNEAASAGSGIMRATAAFTAASSHKLTCTDSAITSLFDGTDAFTLFIPVRRGATGANHTLFSVGTTGSNNGRWDLTLDSSDDISITRVTSGGSSATGTYATTVNTTPILITLTFDGTSYALYVNRTAQSLSGSPTGDVGTASRVTVGCRSYNTSTHDQFATAEIPEVLAWGSALTAAQLTTLHAWAKRRYGV